MAYPSQNAFDGKVNASVRKIIVKYDLLIAGYDDGSIEIFDLNGKNLNSFKAHEKVITNLCLDNSRLISLSEDNSIKIFNIDLGECIYTYYLDIFATSISVNEDKLVVGDTLGNVRFFDYENY